MPLDAKLLVGLHIGTLGLVLGLHAARGYITLGPVLALGGLLTFLAWQIAQAGWWVSWGGLNVNAALFAAMGHGSSKLGTSRLLSGG